MPLDAKTLIYFASTVRCGGLGKAASHLAVEPSTISRAIATLEYELAARLLIRRPEGVTATFEGAQLLQAADLVLGWLNRLAGARTRGAIEIPKPPKQEAPLSLEACRDLLASPVTLRSLAHFSTVIEEGSISSAARRLNLTQPTLGRRMAALETWLGAPLFERSRAGAAPTPLARTLHVASLDVQNLAARLMRRADVGFLHEARDARLGAVMPAGADSSLAVLLARVIQKSGGRDWNRPISVTTAIAAELLESVLAGALDAAIVDIADIPEAFLRIELARRPLHVIAPVLASRQSDDGLQVLAHLPIGLPAHGTGLRNATDHFLASIGTNGRQTIECGSIPVLMRLVIEGVCCAILPRAAVSKEEARVRTFPLRGPGLTTSLIWKASKDATPHVNLIRDLVTTEPFN